MKRIGLILIGIFIYAASWGQSQFPSPNVRPIWNEQEKISKLFWLATTDTTDYAASDYPGAISYRSGDSSLYVSDGHGWHPIASGLTAVTSVTNNKDSLFVNKSDGNTDTLVLNFYTKDSLYTKSQVDSVAAKRASDTTFSNIKIDTVKTISQLENYSDSAKILLVIDSLRGGIFYKKSDIVADSGIIFKGVNTTWIRKFNGYINAAWYGVKGDSLTDNTIAFRRLFSSPYIKNRTIYIPAGIYLVSDSIVVNDRLTLKGDGSVQSKSAQSPSPDYYTASTQIVQASTGPLFIFKKSNINIADIGISTSSSNFGAGMRFVNADYSRINNISVIGFDTLISIQNGREWVISNSRLSDPQEYCLFFNNQNNYNAGDNQIIGTYFYSGANSGETAIKTTIGSGLILNHVKFNANNGIKFDYLIDLSMGHTSSDFILSNSSLEGGWTTSAVRIKVDSVVFNNIIITGNEFQNYYNADNFIDIEGKETINYINISSNIFEDFNPDFTGNFIYLKNANNAYTGGNVYSPDVDSIKIIIDSSYDIKRSDLWGWDNNHIYSNSKVSIATDSINSILNVGGNVSIFGSSPRAQIIDNGTGYPGIEFYKNNSRKWIMYNDAGDNLLVRSNENNVISLSQNAGIKLYNTPFGSLYDSLIVKKTDGTLGAIEPLSTVNIRIDSTNSLFSNYLDSTHTVTAIHDGLSAVNSRIDSVIENISSTDTALINTISDSTSSLGYKNIKSVSGDYILTGTDYDIISSGTNPQITIPDASSYVGKEYKIRCKGTDTDIICATGSQLMYISGSPASSIENVIQYHTIEIHSDGTYWYYEDYQH